MISEKVQYLSKQASKVITFFEEGETMNKMKINLKKLTYFLLCLSFLITMLPTTVVAKNENIRVGAFEGSYNEVDENGRRSGYGYEFQQGVAAYTGWTYKYIKTDWSDCFQKLESGQIDLLGGVSYTEERAKTMLFSDLPMGEEKYFLYTDLASSDILVSDLNTLNGKRVGVLGKSTPESLLKAWERKHNLKLEHVNIISSDDIFDKMKKKQIDCFVSIEEPQWEKSGFSDVTSIGNSGIYFVMNKERKDLKNELDTAMRRIEHDTPFYKEDLYKKFLSAKSYEILTQEELDWIKKHGKIRIGYFKNDVGVSMIHPEYGNLVGVINDYIKHAKDCLGNQELKFDLVGFDSQEEQFYALKENKIDMVFHINQNPNEAEKNGIILTNKVFESNIAVITKKNRFNELDKNIVAIDKENIFSKWYIDHNYPQWKVKEYDSKMEMEKAVLSGKADCFVINAGKSADSLKESEIHRVFLTESASSCFAVNRKNTILLSILNRTLNDTVVSQFSGAVSMYDNSLKKVTLADFVKDNLVLVMFLLLGAFSVVLSVILALLHKAKKSQLQAELANEAKTNFLFNMSHDIRTPMNALLGYNELMKRELKDPKLLDYQKKVEQSGNLLLSILNNVLDMARIESGKIELDENCINITHLTKEVCEVFQIEAKKKEIDFRYEFEVEHDYIMCDEIKMKEIMVNLLSNAIKYTSPGGRVRLNMKELPCDKKGYARIKSEVIDTGIGMSKQFLPTLFEPFARERNTTIGKIAGTGLGLPIVKRYIEKMGGKIDVESELGKGSKFSFVIEYKIANRIYYKKNRNETLDFEREIQGKRILLAEDNDLNAEIATTILEDMGLVVERVRDGIQCVSKIEQMSAKTYDLILMDIQMPNMDGYKATLAIRRLKDQDKANIPIVAMTANAFEEDKKEALSKGMNGHIAKPIDIDKMIETLEYIL